MLYIAVPPAWKTSNTCFPRRHPPQPGSAPRGAGLPTVGQPLYGLELHLVRTAKIDNPQAFARLQSIPGVGKILGLILLYEIHDAGRFPEAGNFLSYARLVRPGHESAGKPQGFGNKKIGNAHLRRALGEAACLYLRSSDQAKRWQARMHKKHAPGKTLGILAAKLGRTCYHLLRTKTVFDERRFFAW